MGIGGAMVTCKQLALRNALHRETTVPPALPSTHTPPQRFEHRVTRKSRAHEMLLMHLTINLHYHSFRQLSHLPFKKTFAVHLTYSQISIPSLLIFQLRYYAMSLF